MYAFGHEVRTWMHSSDELSTRVVAIRRPDTASLGNISRTIRSALSQKSSRSYVPRLRRYGPHSGVHSVSPWPGFCGPGFQRFQRGLRHSSPDNSRLNAGDRESGSREGVAWCRAASQARRRSNACFPLRLGNTKGESIRRTVACCWISSQACPVNGNARRSPFLVVWSVMTWRWKSTSRQCSVRISLLRAPVDSANTTAG